MGPAKPLPQPHAERRAAAGQLLGGGGGGRKYQKTDPTTLGREGRERGIEEKIEGEVKKQKGRKKGMETCKIRAGSARRGAGAALGSPRQRRRDRAGLCPPAPFVIYPLEFVSSRRRERLRPRQSK